MHVDQCLTVHVHREPLTLNMADSGYLHDAALTCLAPCTPSHSPLHSLDLSCCSRITWDALGTLGRAGTFDRLEFLRLSSCDMLRKGIGEPAMDGMCRALQRARLRELYLDGCRVPVDVMHAMATCTSLQRLSLVRCTCHRCATHIVRIDPGWLSRGPQQHDVDQRVDQLHCFDCPGAGWSCELERGHCAARGRCRATQGALSVQAHRPARFGMVFWTWIIVAVYTGGYAGHCVGTGGLQPVDVTQAGWLWSIGGCRVAALAATLATPRADQRGWGAGDDAVEGTAFADAQAGQLSAYNDRGSAGGAGWLSVRAWVYAHQRTDRLFPQEPDGASCPEAPGAWYAHTFIRIPVVSPTLPVVSCCATPSLLTSVE